MITSITPTRDQRRELRNLKGATASAEKELKDTKVELADLRAKVDAQPQPRKWAPIIAGGVVAVTSVLVVGLAAYSGYFQQKEDSGNPNDLADMLSGKYIG